MGVLGFFGSYGKSKISDVQQSLLQRLVAWDPATASEAEINEMIKELDKVTIEVGKAHADYDKEKREAEAARANYTRYMGAAELLQQRIANGEDSDGQKGLQKSLESLVDKLEELHPEVDREEAEAKEAEEYYEELKQVAEATADKLKKARSMLAKAQQDMRRAELDRERAKDKAERAEVLAGIKKDSGSLGVALQAMQEQAKKARAEAEASSLKADLLGDAKKEDSNIQDALRSVDGTNTSTMSTSDRLAALKR